MSCPVMGWPSGRFVAPATWARFGAVTVLPGPVVPEALAATCACCAVELAGPLVLSPDAPPGVAAGAAPCAAPVAPAGGAGVAGAPGIIAPNAAGED